MAVIHQSLKDLNKFIHTNLEYYSEINTDDIKKIEQFLSKLPIKIQLNKFIEMRNLYMYMLSKRKGILTNRYGDYIIKRYHNNESIIQIANKYKLPPLSVLYQILIELKYETHVIEKMLTHTKRMPSIIQQQLSDINKTNPLLWLPSINVNIYNDIKKLGVEFEYKKKLAPLVIFRVICSYNKIQFNWIEIKKYMLFDNKLILMDINKTIHKYAKYGKGLVLFSDIICSPQFIKKLQCHVGNYMFFKQS